MCVWTKVHPSTISWFLSLNAEFKLILFLFFGRSRFNVLLAFINFNAITVANCTISAEFVWRHRCRNERNRNVNTVRRHSSHNTVRIEIKFDCNFILVYDIVIRYLVNFYLSMLNIADVKPFCDLIVFYDWWEPFNPHKLDNLFLFQIPHINYGACLRVHNDEIASTHLKVRIYVRKVVWVYHPCG